MNGEYSVKSYNNVYENPWIVPRMKKIYILHFNYPY